jgi:hypothetical protein
LRGGAVGPVETLEAGHVHMPVDPAAVADALRRLVAATLRP